MKYQSIKENAPNDEVAMWCEVLDVSRSAYYNWLQVPYRVRALRDATIKSSIKEIDKVAANRYGYRAMHAHLRSLDVSCGKDRVLRLMHEMQLAQRPGKRFKPIGTNSRHNYGYHPNLLKSHGAPTSRNQVWVADSTYIRVEGGFTYQATVMDLYNREIVGWSISSRNDSNLVTEALTNAFRNRGGAHAGLIHHSDRGSTYASQAYQKVLLEHGVKPSMSAKGNCYDNAAMESFFGRFKTSTVKNKIYKDETQVRDVVFEYVEIFYNRFRKHAALGYRSPIEFVQWEIQQKQSQMRLAA
ncbi:MAG: IS3 family transposase [Abditibacteriaceae bacterium]